MIKKRFSFIDSFHVTYYPNLTDIDLFITRVECSGYFCRRYIFAKMNTTYTRCIHTRWVHSILRL